MTKFMDKFIEYDNHNGITLLKAALMNAISKASSILSTEYTLVHIPLSLLLDCLTGFEINFEWKDEDEYIIDVFDHNIKILNINGNIKRGNTTIRSAED